ncbi:MAG: lipid-A-disaccharide synthase, partial [Candidatus Hydrogenedentes bacterium]|nr:lipid-A-disaccharide synthase [Candidatus Hydrogenedentota bacterium]
MTRVFFSAGESSGDLHGGNLIRALRTLDPAIRCEGIGGQRMADAGMELRYDLAARAIMGFTEVVRSFALIRRLFNDTVERLRATPPDALVLIAYPGFNMRLGKKARELNLPVVY